MNITRGIAWVAGGLWAAAAVAQPVTPWLKVEVLSGPFTGAPRFAGVGAFYWTDQSNAQAAPYASTWRQAGSFEAARMLTPPASPSGGVSGYNRMQLLGIADNGVPFGDGQDRLGNAFVWMQQAEYPFAVQSLGLAEAVHVGAAGQHGSGLASWTETAGALLGWTRRFNAGDPLYTDVDYWVWHADVPGVRPLSFTEGGQRLVVNGYGTEGGWAWLQTLRRNGRGAQAWLVNMLTGEQRRLGFVDADHTRDAGDFEPDAPPGFGFQSSSIDAIDDHGHALVASMRYSPNETRREWYLYNWADGSYTPVADVPEDAPGDTLHCAPSMQRFVVGKYRRIRYASALDRSEESVRLLLADQQEDRTQLNAIWWSHDEPTVVGTTFPVQAEGSWAPGNLFTWRPSDGVSVLAVPGFSANTWLLGTSPSGRFALIRGERLDGERWSSRIAVYDLEQHRMTVLPDQSGDSPVGTVEAALLGESVLAVYHIGTSDKVAVRLIDPTGATIDPTSQFLASLGEFDAGYEGTLWAARGSRVQFTAVRGGANVPAFVTLVNRCSPADLSGVGVTDGPDQALDNNDIIRFIALFFAADPRADFGSAGGLAGPDGAFNNNDFIAFITAFFADCGD